LAACGYFEFCADLAAQRLRGRAKRIQHACEAETSLMLAVRPDLVRLDRAVDDGLTATPPIRGLITTFGEITSEGVLGEATLADAALGRALLAAAIEGASEQARSLAQGVIFQGLPEGA
jgi:creatinine amidohydrolase